MENTFHYSILIGAYRAQYSIAASMESVWGKGTDPFQDPLEARLRDDYRKNNYSCTFWIHDYNGSRMETEQAAQEAVDEFNETIDIGQYGFARAELIYEGEYIYVEMFETDKGIEFRKALKDGFFYDLNKMEIDIETTRVLMEFVLGEGRGYISSYEHRLFQRNRHPAHKELVNRYMLNKLAGNYDMC